MRICRVRVFLDGEQEFSKFKSNQLFRIRTETTSFRYLENLELTLELKSCTGNIFVRKNYYYQISMQHVCLVFLLPFNLSETTLGQVSAAYIF